MENNLPKFVIHRDEDDDWFVIIEGELTGLMFRVVDVSTDDYGLAVDYAINQQFEGGAEMLEQKKELVDQTIQKFIDFAFEDVAKNIESQQHANLRLPV